jgi:hypothetical protein
LALVANLVSFNVDILPCRLSGRTRGNGGVRLSPPGEIAARKRREGVAGEGSRSINQ